MWCHHGALCPLHSLPCPPPGLFQSHSHWGHHPWVLTQLWEIDLWVSTLCTGEVGGKSQACAATAQGHTGRQAGCNPVQPECKEHTWSAALCCSIGSLSPSSKLCTCIKSITHIDSVLMHFRHKRGSTVSNLVVQWVILQ